MRTQAEASDLTELEGAVLSEIHHRGHDTAFRVRRAFQTSPSIEWSGSAGAVYPAVRRLERRGLIRADPAHDGRATKRLSLTPPGEAVLLAWACDATRAASVGLDPFRLRSGIWGVLTDAQRRDTLRATARAIEANLAYLHGYAETLDGVEATRVTLSMRLQELRLAWLTEQLGRNPP